MAYPTLTDEIRNHNVRAYKRGEGSRFAIGDDIEVVWKAEGAETGYAFSSYEVSLAPNRGLFLHKHPYAEFFYVLEGVIDFERLTLEGKREWVSCGAGESLLAPPNAPHGFFNRGDRRASFLAVSTFAHEHMLKESKTPHGTLKDGYPDPTPQGFEELSRSQRRDQVFYLQENDTETTA